MGRTLAAIRHCFFSVFGATLALVFLLVSPALAQQNWVTIAIGENPSTGTQACGLSWNYPTEYAAELAALTICRQSAAGYTNARILQSASNGYAVSIQWGGSYAAGGWGSTFEEALGRAKYNASIAGAKMGDPVGIFWVVPDPVRPAATAYTGNYADRFDRNPVVAMNTELEEMSSATGRFDDGVTARIAAALRVAPSQLYSGILTKGRFDRQRSAVPDRAAIVFVAKPETQQSITTFAGQNYFALSTDDAQSVRILPGVTADEFSGGMVTTFLIRDISAFPDLLAALSGGKRLHLQHYFIIQNQDRFSQFDHPVRIHSAWLVLATGSLIPNEAWQNAISKYLPEIKKNILLGSSEAVHVAPVK